jgi:ABC-type nickel/cobalt efflux system permease component RcnA
MKRFMILLILVILLLLLSSYTYAQNPFTSKPNKKPTPTAPAPMIKSPIFVKIILWQHQLKEKMAQLIRGMQNGNSIMPLIFLMGLAFTYGAIHAAGPGHGKVVAMSYVLSHRPSVAGGVTFGMAIALIHGASGVFGVLGLRYIIQRGVSDTLASVTAVTQIVSFGMIILLGLGILSKHAYGMFAGQKGSWAEEPQSRKNIWPWAVAVGIVPCPAVVMVMLFCISMGVTILGLVLALCIAVGMAATLSVVVAALIMGKAGAMRTVSKKRFERAEGIVGLLSGAAIVVFGTFFLLPAIHAAVY